MEVEASPDTEYMPSSVDLEEVMREMKEQTLAVRMAHAAKDSGVWLTNFVASNKLFLAICVALLTSAFGGFYAWQVFYPQYLKTQITRGFEDQDYETVIALTKEYRTFQISDAEVIYISALSNLKLQNFEQAFIEMQILSSLDSSFQTDVDFTFYQALISHEDINDSLILVARSLEAEPTHLPSILLRGLYGTLPKSGVTAQIQEEYIQKVLEDGIKGSAQYSDQIRTMLTYIAANSKALFLPLSTNPSALFEELGSNIDESGRIYGFNNAYSLAFGGIREGNEESNLDVNIRVFMLLTLINSYSSAEEAGIIASQLRADFGSDPANDIAGYVAAAHYAQQGEFELASELYARVYELNPNDPDTILNLANARLQITPENFQVIANEYSNVISLDPNNAVALNNRGFLNLWFADNINKAKLDFEQVAATEEDDRNIIAFYNLGRAYLKGGEPRKAVSEFNKVVDSQPAFGDVLLYRGMANRAAGEFEYAIKDFNDFKLQDPESVMPYIQSARLFGASAGYKLALNELRTATELQPDNEGLAMMLADFYLSADQFQNAESLLATFPDMGDENPDRKLIAGRLLLGKGDLFRAEQMLKEVYNFYALKNADEVNPEKTLEAAVHYLEVLDRNGRVDEVLELTRTLLPKNQNNVDLLRIRAKAFNEKGRNTEALRFAQRAVEIDPLIFELQMVLGDVFSSSGRFQDAIQAYRTAQKIRPAALDALYKIENLLDLLNQPEELGVIREQIARVESEQLLVRESEQALDVIQNPSSGVIGDTVVSEAQIAQLMGSIDEINAKIEENPDSGTLYYNRGVIELSIEEVGAAVDSMKRAVETEPENQDFQMGLASAYLRANDYNNAVESLDAIIELDENNFEAVYNRAVAHHNNNDYQQAIIDYTTAVRLNPAYTNAYYNRGTIYVEFAEYYRAIEEFSRVIELRPDGVKPYLARAQVYRLVGENDKAENDMQAAQLLRASEQQ